MAVRTVTADERLQLWTDTRGEQSLRALFAGENTNKEEKKRKRERERVHRECSGYKKCQLQALGVLVAIV